MSEFIAEAKVLVLPDVGKFRAELEAQLLAATKGVVVPVSVAATTTGTAGAASAQKTLAAATLEASDAQRLQNQLLGRGAVLLDAEAIAAEQAAASEQALGAAQTKAAAAASENAAAQRLAARAAAENAKNLGQLERGAAASALSLFGLRGATLAASGRFLIGTAAVILFAKGIKEASDQTEQLNKSREVFGRFSKEVEDFAKTSATGFGESNAKALELVSTFGALLRPIGFTQQAAQQESIALTKLGADLASFFNTDVSDALAAIQSGLVGQVRPLRRYGIELSAARVNALALADSGKKVVTALTDQEKVAARIKIIFRDSTIAQGDFARTSGEFANQTRILAAETANLEGELGKLAIPTLTVLLNSLTGGLAIINKFAEGLDRIAGAARDVARDIKSIPQGRLPLPEVPDEQSGGGGLRGILGDVANLENRLRQLPQLFHGTFLPIQKDSEQTAQEIQKIFSAAQETGSAAQLIGDLQKLQDTLETGTPTQRASAAAVQDLVDAIAHFASENNASLPSAARFQAILKLLGIILPTTVKGVRDLAGGLGEVSAAARGAAFSIQDAANATKNLSQASSVAAANLLRIQSEGGGPQAQLPAAQQQLAADQALLAQALSQSSSEKGRATAVKKAREAIVADRAFIKSLQGEITAGQQQTANEARQRAQDAVQEQTDATQAFIQSFAPKQQALANKLTNAELFGTAKQVIAANKAIIAADKQEIAAIRAFIRQRHLHGAALKAALAEINRLNQEIFNTRNDIAQAQAARKQNIADTRQAHLEALLAIAETTKSTRDDRAAQKALIAFDNAQIHRILKIKKRRRLTQEEAAQLDAYRVDLAQRNAALKEVTEQTKETGRTFSQAAFAFLQTQQGFAANLLGNLIPGFATAGLVGNASPSGQGPAQGLRDPQERPLVAAQVAGSRDRGVRPIQVDTTNQLLRQILRSLQGLNARSSHPEARYQDRVAGSNFDTIGGV